jgi:C1A family cysteine protease
MYKTMSTFILSSLFVSVSSFIHPLHHYEFAFRNWMQQHNVVSTNLTHYTHMLSNYAANDDLIESHNQLKDIPYVLGHNKFSHLNTEEFSMVLNTNKYFEYDTSVYDDDTTSDDDNALFDDYLSVEDVYLPLSVDWTTQGAVTGVKDQGNCGSCWSFSATGALEGAYKIKYGTLISFSEQNLVSCDNIDSACNGGLMDNAFTWTMRNGGLCTESGYPYTSGTTGQKGTCMTTCSKNVNVAPRSYTDVQKNSDSALMTAIAKQPVSIAIQANQPDFQLYKSGVLTGNCGTNLDHGVLAVGYGTWTDGTDYYKVKNSWGTGWGMGGYILIQRGKNQQCGECGILCGPPSYPNL